MGSRLLIVIKPSGLRPIGFCSLVEHVMSYYTELEAQRVKVSKISFFLLSAGLPGNLGPEFRRRQLDVDVVVGRRRVESVVVTVAACR